MSASHPYKLKLDAVAKTIVDRIILDWEVDSIATVNATLRTAESLAAFIEVDVERDDVNIFNGRIEKPTIQFSRGGRPMPISGFDWTSILGDYPTTSQSIVDSTVAAALTAILSEVTDVTLTEVVDGVFELITALQDWDESHEMLTTIPTYNNCSIEYALTDVEIQDEFADGRTIADFGISGTNNCFFYDGATERYYIFTHEGLDIIYYHSPDGTTWTRVDSGINSNSHWWSVAWYSNKVYLFVDDGGGFTDFYRGTITDATGTIAFALITNNIFNTQILFGPVWDNQGDMWVVDDSALGSAYESVNDGVAWNLRFSGAANHMLWGVMPEGTDGDMVTLVVDIINEDLEEWLWDRSAGTHTFVAKIRDTTGDIDSLDAAMNDNYAICIAWTDGITCYHAYRVASGNWTLSTLIGNPANDYITVSCDGYKDSYVFVNVAAGFTALKYENGVLDTTFTDSDLPWNTSGLLVGGTRCWGQDGVLAAGFGCGTDVDDDGWFFLFDPTGIRLNRGDATGNFITDTVNASGGMTAWGMLTAGGIGISNGVDVLWDITDVAAVILADDQTAPFDLDLVGVDPSETAIKIQCFLVDSGTDPYVYEFDITEMTDNVSLDTDFEDAYTGVRKLADLADAEFYVTKDNGTYTITFTTRRGSDKSNTVILKNATTSDEPETIANIKLLDKTFDWTNYANIVQVIGGQDADGNRVIGVVRDNEEIADKGKEYWFTRIDADIITIAMARQRAYLELLRRNTVTLRIEGEFLDNYDSGQIEIGDSVTLIAEWPDAELKISGSHRIVKLHREWGVRGERVVAEFTTQLRQTQFWNYLRLTSDQSRWITT